MSSDRPVPVVDFYGESRPWSTTELLHSEPLAERSQKNDWQIRPHRHSRLTQLFLLQKGIGTAHLDTVGYSTSPPCVVVVPEMCVHEFAWARNSSGYVLSLASPLVHELSREFGSMSTTFGMPAVIDIAVERGHVITLFEEIDREHRQSLPLKGALLESLIRALAISLFRQPDPGRSGSIKPGRASRHHSRFLALVEEHHKSQRSVASYANEIGITAPHLNAICQKLARMSALGIIHERLLLAARRNLVYTEKTIAGVSLGLGFSDASYFTRFFKRHTGMSPSQFRRRSGTYNGGE